MNREKLKSDARQYINNNPGKMLVPIAGFVLWAIILAVSTVCYILLTSFVSRIFMLFLLPLIIFYIIVIEYLHIKTAQYYLKVVRGQKTRGLKTFFFFFQVYPKIWKMFVLDILTIALSLLFIFIPGYIVMLYSIKFHIICDFENKKAKEYLELIPDLTQHYVIKMAIVKLSFFWWNLLSIVTLGFAYIFYVKPYQDLTQAGVYNSLLKIYNKNQNNQDFNDENNLDDNNYTAKDDIAVSEEAETQLTFEDFKNQFSVLESNLEKYITFKYNYKDIALCEYIENMQNLLATQTEKLEYANTNTFTKQEIKQIKDLINDYNNLFESAVEQEDEEYSNLVSIIKTIIDDRIKVLQLEVMKVNKISFGTLFGNRIRLLKNNINYFSKRESAQTIVDGCNVQLKQEKTRTAVMASIVLFVLIACIVIPIALVEALAPKQIVTINNITYRKEGGSYVVSYVDKYSNYVRIEESISGVPVRIIGDYAFQDCAVSTIVIPKSIYVIQGYAFSNCKNLTNVLVPTSVNTIGLGAFNGCDNLQEITVPFIGRSPYQEGEFGYIFGAYDYSMNSYMIPLSLNKVIVSEGAYFIKSYAFAYCNNLTEIELPSSMANIYSYAFYNCSNLDVIRFNGTTYQWSNIYKEYGWDTSIRNCVIQCTNGNV